MYLLKQYPFLYSLILHAIIISALIISFDAVHQPIIRSWPKQNIVQAVTVDERAVARELQRLTDIERAREQKLENARKDLEKQAVAVKSDRIEVEQIEKQLAEEWDLIDEEKLKIKEESDRIKEHMLNIAEDKKRKDAEKKTRKAEDVLLAELNLKQQKQDQIILQDINVKIYRVVTGNFNKTGLPKGLECMLSVQTIPGGEVISVTVSQSSGNEIFDRRAVTAVEKSSPLPLPADPATFDRLRLRILPFKFKPRD